MRPLAAAPIFVSPFVALLVASCGDGGSPTTPGEEGITTNEPPVVDIAAPVEGVTVEEGAAVLLVATSSDPEDGDLSGSIRWSSDRDGDLGVGGSLSVDLSVGTHTITATVTDGGGRSATASVDITVEASGTEGAWSPVGSGASGDVRSVHVGPSGIYIGGDFNAAGGQVVNHIARFDGSDWQPMAAGLDFDFGVQEIVADGSGKVYVAEQQGEGRIVQWDGAAFTELPPIPPEVPPFSDGIRAIAVAPDGRVFASMDRGSRLFRLKEGVWEMMEAPSEWGIRTFAVGPEGEIYAATGGGFGASDGEIVRLDGDVWTTIGTTNEGISTLTVDGEGNLYAGGGFTIIDGMIASGIARWDGSEWAPLGGGITDGGEFSSVGAIAVAPDGLVYAGGNLDEMGGVEVRRIAVFDGEGWAPLGGGVFGGVRDLAMDQEGRLYVGGLFAQVDVFTGREAVEAVGIALWDPDG